MCFKYTYGGIIMDVKYHNYKPKDFAELIGVSVKTLQRWDRGRNSRRQTGLQRIGVIILTTNIFNLKGIKPKMIYPSSYLCKSFYKRIKG